MSKSIVNKPPPISSCFLYYGDCLNALYQDDIHEESIDLVYLDPPFNSKGSYNVLFGTGKDPAQSEAFQDLWTWNENDEATYRRLCTSSNVTLARTCEGLRKILGESGMLSYLLYMGERLIALHRVLKSTGSIYLHCDDVACHYLKVLMDSVFGPQQFRNHLIWRRAISHNDPSRFGRILDHILFYAKGPKPYWNGKAIATPKTEQELKEAYPYQDDRGSYRADNMSGPLHQTAPGRPSTLPWKNYDVYAKGRCWAIPKTGAYAEYIETHWIPNYRSIKGVHDRLDALDVAGLIHHPRKAGAWPGLKRYAQADQGKPPQNLFLNPLGWTNYNRGKGEYLGYPTQKPQALLEQLIAVSCPVDGVVLDPFCGCGTTVDAAEKLRCRWIGCDISYLSIDLIESRLLARHGKAILSRYVVVGTPEDINGAERLALKSLQANYNGINSPKTLEEAWKMAERRGAPGEKYGKNAGRFEFQRWAVSLVDGLPNDREIGDQGVDGILLWENPEDTETFLKGAIQVKSGRVTPNDLRALQGLLDTKQYEAGLLITLYETNTEELQRIKAAAKTWKPSKRLRREYPRLQIWSVEEFFKKSPPEPDLPPRLDPVVAQEKNPVQRQQLHFF